MNQFSVINSNFIDISQQIWVSSFNCLFGIIYSRLNLTYLLSEQTVAKGSILSGLFLIYFLIRQFKHNELFFIDIFINSHQKFIFLIHNKFHCFSFSLNLFNVILKH